MEISGVSTTGSSQTQPVDATNWGKFVNPQGGHLLRHTDAVSNRLTITVPGTRPFNLMKGFNYDAPRLLEEIAGDFVIEVKLPPWQRPLAGTSSRGPDGNSYLGAGLVVWIDEQNLLKWERSAWGELNGGAPFLHAEWCAAGVRADKPDTPTGEDGAVYLQIERRGGQLTLRASADGTTWQSRYIVTDFKRPPRLSVGLFAQNSTNVEFSPVFERLAIANK
jgi:hypothetical protein